MPFVHPARFHLYSFHLVGCHAISSFLYTRKVVSDRVSNKLYEEKVLYLVIKKVQYFFSFFHIRKFVSYRVPKKLYYSLDSGVSLLCCGLRKSNQKHDCRVFTDDKRHMQTTQFKRERKKVIFHYSFICLQAYYMDV